MITVSEKQQARAAGFICERARPLEKQLYLYHFEQGPSAAAVAELAKYQNSDGGLGNGLEPDLRTPCSSALATSNGLATLRELGAPAGSPVVEGAIGYLLDTLDPNASVWQIVPAETNDAPHAPWMGYDDKLAERWKGFLANPRATIVASLLRYSSLVPADLLAGLLDAVVEHLAANIDSVDMHEFHCYADLLQVDALPPLMRQNIVSGLRAALERLVQRDSAAWESYNLRPLDVVSSPDSPFADLFAAEIEENLDYLVQGQLEDGTWPVTWSWGGAFPDVWPVAEKEWKGILIVANMEKLRAFGRT